MASIVQPTYSRILPSTGKNVSFRPFTVKEEKALLLALTEGDLQTLATAIEKIIYACTDGLVDPAKVPYYDVEYLFLQIRSKSIGEIIQMVGTCDCAADKKIEFEVDIGTLTIEPKPSGTTRIKIPDTDYTIEFRHPSLADFVLSNISKGEDATQIVANCMLKVFTDTEVMDWNEEEKLEFVDSMSTKQQRDIAVFLKDMPRVVLPTPYKCMSCGKEHNNTLSGFENFFV